MAVLSLCPKCLKRHALVSYAGREGRECAEKTEEAIRQAYPQPDYLLYHEITRLVWWWG